MEPVVFWKRELETLPRADLRVLQLARFKERMQHLIDRSPLYRRKYERAGIKPDDLRQPDDIRRVPFTTKEELQQSQAEHPPWGDFCCVPEHEVVRVFQTSGTTGTPLRVAINGHDWFEIFYEQFMHFMHGYGITSSDVLYVPFNYGLFIAWWGFQTAMEKAGVTIVPGGGQRTEERVRGIVEWNATVVCGTPSYVLFLAETARKMGISLADSAVRIVVTAGEPGANVPATKKAIEELWGAKCYDDVGSTEITNFGFECVAQQGTHVIESMFIAETIDPETLQPLPAGELGELVLSNLCTQTMPLLRYRIRDMVRLNLEPCPCGRTFLRMEGGILGRSDDMFQFSGTNVFPSAVENIIREIEQFSLEYQLVAPVQGSGDSLIIRVEPARAGLPAAALHAAAGRLGDSVRDRMSFTPRVEIAEVGSLPRFEGKAQRVVRQTAGSAGA